MPFKVSFSLYPDETTDFCDLILPDLHSLETWGDAEPAKGTLALQQPAMDPVFPGTRATADVLIARPEGSLDGVEISPADYRAWLMGRSPGVWPQSPRRWRRASSPAVPRPASCRRPLRCRRAADRQTRANSFSSLISRRRLATGAAPTSPGCRSCPILSRRFSWSPSVELHPETANKLGIEQGDIATVETAQGKVPAPVYLYLGLRPDTIAIAVGQGHSAVAKLDDHDGKNYKVIPTQWGYGRYARNVGVRAHACSASAAMQRAAFRS